MLPLQDDRISVERSTKAYVKRRMPVFPVGSAFSLRVLPRKRIILGNPRSPTISSGETNA